MPQQVNINPNQQYIPPQGPNQQYIPPQGPNQQYVPPQPYVPPEKPIVLDQPLQELANVDCALIDEEMDLLEVMTGCETKNKYRVTIPGQSGTKDLFLCEESSGCCSRNCLGPGCHPFRMKIQHLLGSNLIKGVDFVNPYAVFDRHCQCTCCCFNRPQIKLYYKEKNVYGGKIMEPCSVFSPYFHIFDSDGLIKYTININCCQYGFCCRNNCCGSLVEAKFLIYEGPDFSKHHVGQIVRKVNGKNLISKADTFSIEFPPSATPNDKMLMICAVLMIDYLYYSESPSQKEIEKELTENQKKS